MNHLQLMGVGEGEIKEDTILRIERDWLEDERRERMHADEEDNASNKIN